MNTDILYLNLYFWETQGGPRGNSKKLSEEKSHTSIQSVYPLYVHSICNSWVEAEVTLKQKYSTVGQERKDILAL